jgi:hypothetical protein
MGLFRIHACGKILNHMKTAIHLTAMALLFSAGALAATPKVKHHKTEINTSKQLVSIIPLKHDRGFAARVDKTEPGKSMIFITDINGDMVFKDCLTKDKTGEKKYLLRELADGKYTLDVYTKGSGDVKTNFYIYYNTGTKRRVVDIM